MSAEYRHSKPSENQSLPKDIEKFFNEKNPAIGEYIARCNNNHDFNGKQLFAFASGVTLTYKTIEQKGRTIPHISSDALNAYNKAKNLRLDNGLLGDMETEWMGEWKNFLKSDPEVSRRVFNVGWHAGLDEKDFVAFLGGSAAVSALIREEEKISNLPNEIEVWLQDPQ